MQFNLDFALFYAYTLALFAALLLWLLPNVFRALVDSFRAWRERGRASEPELPPPSVPTTRLEAFTRW